MATIIFTVDELAAIRGSAIPPVNVPPVVVPVVPPAVAPPVAPPPPTVPTDDYLSSVVWPPYAAGTPEIRDLALFCHALDQLGVRQTAAHIQLMAWLGNADHQTALGAQVEQGAAGGSAQGDYSDRQVYQIIAQLQRYKNAQRVFDVFPTGAVSIAKIVHYQNMMVLYHVT